MDIRGPRLAREINTVRVMIAMYCRHHHPGRGRCPECDDLMGYAIGRLEKCPFGEGKTVCSICPVHCFKPELRRQIRLVMRFAGPKMTLNHPLMAVRYLLDRRRKQPLKSVVSAR